MLSLEEVLLSLRAKDTVTLIGETYKVQNIISATDGTILKAKLILVKPEEPSFCVNIEISTQVHEGIRF
jgi:hypothetical protein